jgi:hypothetical protein
MRRVSALPFPVRRIQDDGSQDVACETSAHLERISAELNRDSPAGLDS